MHRALHSRVHSRRDRAEGSAQGNSGSQRASAGICRISEQQTVRGTPKKIRRLEKEKATMQKRKAELDAIFKKLYEDSVLGRITSEQFQMLSASYTDEQAKLTEALPQREAVIQRLKETVSNAAAFLEKAKRYTDITELTPERLRLFIEKIVGHEKEAKWSKHAPQTVEIYCNGIGCVGSQQQDMESPQPRKTEEPRQAS